MIPFDPAPVSFSWQACGVRCCRARDAKSRQPGPFNHAESDMATIPNKKPTVKKTSWKGLVNSVAGKEQSYDVYRFSRGVRKYERPKHNPFSS
jgi:hypothetical protein